MLEKLLESLDKEVFTAEMVDSLIVQFNESVEGKAKEIADAQLAEAVEKALAEAKEANQNSSDNKEWNFVLKATDESANGIYTVAVLDSDGREKTSQIEIKNFDFILLYFLQNKIL